MGLLVSNCENPCQCGSNPPIVYLRACTQHAGNFLNGICYFNYSTAYDYNGALLPALDVHLSSDTFAGFFETTWVQRGTGNIFNGHPQTVKLTVGIYGDGQWLYDKTVAGSADGFGNCSCLCPFGDEYKIDGNPNAPNGIPLDYITYTMMTSNWTQPANDGTTWDSHGITKQTLDVPSILSSVVLAP